MDEEDIEYFSHVFKALADATRQRILELLRKNGEMTVNQITGKFDLAQPTDLAAPAHIERGRRTENP